MTITAISKLSTLTSTTVASYADLQGATTDESLSNALSLNGSKANFTEIQADHFAQTFQLIHQRPNVSLNGFSASLFREKATGQHVIAIRGTEEPILDLFVTDGLSIGGNGFANNQAVEMFRYFKSLTTAGGQQVQYSDLEVWQMFAIKNSLLVQLAITMPLPTFTGGLAMDFQNFKQLLASDVGIIPPLGSLQNSVLSPLDTVNVTGHSLGGHLAMLFARFFPANVDQVVTLNAPGFFPQGDAALARFGFPQVDATRITRIEADGDGISKIGTIWPGSTVLIAQETGAGTFDPILGNHSSVNGNDGLSLMAVMSSLDPSLVDNARKTSDFLRVASNSPEKTYESALDALRLFILGEGKTPTPISSGASDPNRNSLYSNLYELLAPDALGMPTGIFSYLQGDVQLINAPTIGTSGKSDFGALLALKYLIPFALKPIDGVASTVLESAHSVLATEWHEDNRLTAEDREKGKANYSDAYLSDRAAMLSWVVKRNGQDDTSTVMPGQNVLFKDAQTGTDIRMGTTWDSSRRQFIFGSDKSESYSGGGLDDRIYGGNGADRVEGRGGDDLLEGNQGNDTLVGAAGHDRLIGGAGDDSLEGGTGHDILKGVDGFDRYVIQSGDGIDTVLDSDGKGSLVFNGSPLSGGMHKHGSLHYGGLWHDSDTKTTYVYQVETGAPSGTLVIKRGTDVVNVKHWKSGDLGITLEDSSLPIAVPESGRAIVGDLQAFEFKTHVNTHANYLPYELFAASLMVPTLDGHISSGRDYVNGNFSAEARAKADIHNLIATAQIPDRAYTYFATAMYRGEPIFADIVYHMFDDLGNTIGGIPVPADWDDTSHGDALYGSEGGDQINAGRGNDWVMAGGGDDVIIGGSEGGYEGYIDMLSGEAGNDYLFVDAFVPISDLSSLANYGGSEAEARPGNWAYGEQGDDYLIGGKREDILFGGAGKDVLTGGAGNDVLNGDQSRVPHTIEGRIEIQNTGNPFDRTVYVIDFPGATTALPRDVDVTQDSAGSDDILYGGAGNDRLHGGRGDDILVGNVGDDLVTGEDGDDYILGGEGNDRLTGEYNGGTYGDGQRVQSHGNDYIDGGEGNDILQGEGGADVLFGGSGDDYVYGDGYFYSLSTAQSGDDYLDGGSGADVLVGQAGNDLLVGGLGDDTLMGGDGDDVYIINAGEGNDRIVDSSGRDKIIFGEGVDQNSIKLGLGSLLIRIGETGSEVHIENFDPDNALNSSSIASLEFANGSSISYAQLLELGFDIAGSGDISGTSVDDRITGSEGDDIISAGHGNDVLAGLGGADFLRGGSGNDTLDGGSGNDRLSGGEGNNVYLFKRGDGLDIIEPGVGINVESDKQEVIRFDASIQASDVEVAKVGVNLELRVTGTADVITVSNWFDHAAYWIEKIEFADGTIWTALDITARFPAEPTPGNDVLIGTSDGDEIDGGDGNDTMYGIGGNDVLQGGAGDDVLLAGAGDDTLIGGTGNDILNGGTGNNVYEFGRDFGSDFIQAPVQGEEAGMTGIVRFDDTVSPARVTVKRVDSDLELALGVDHRLVISDWFGSSGHYIVKVEFASGIAWNVEDILAQVPPDVPEVPEGDSLFLGTNIDDSISGFERNDHIYGFGGNDSIRGKEGNDHLHGDAGNDELYGGVGDDTYYFALGTGHDFISDSSGDNTISLAAEILPDAVKVTSDGFGMLHLVFSGGADRVSIEEWQSDDGYSISRVKFGDGTEWMPSDLEQRITKLSATQYGDIISGDSFDEVLDGLTGDDYVFGNDGNDVLVGGDGDDYVAGGGHDDIMNGGAGADTLEDWEGNNLFDAGAGDDYVFSEGAANFIAGGKDGDYIISIGTNNVIAINSGDGTDTISVEAPMTISLGGEVEESQLALSISASDLVLSIGDDQNIRFESFMTRYTPEERPAMTLQIVGQDIRIYDLNAVISDFEAAVAGDEQDASWPIAISLVAHTAATYHDKAIGGIVAYQYAKEGTLNGLEPAKIYSAISSSTFGSQAEAVGASIPLIINGTPYDDILQGGNAADTLFGLDGRDTLRGGDGSDLLDGGTGNDTMVGNAGDDIYIVEDSGDSTLELANEGIDHVRSSVTLVLAPNIENLTLVGTSAIDGTGNSLDNVLTGNEAPNVLKGGLGNDVYVVSEGDTVAESANQGLDLVKADVDYKLGSNIENLTLTGTSDVNGTGNSLSNVITGNAGANAINGGAGGDTMLGAEGNDTYTVDNVADVVIEQADEGSDLVLSSVDYSLSAHVEGLKLIGSTAFKGAGNALDNVLTGNSNANVLEGMEGNDTLVGGAGADTLKGGVGNDIYAVDVIDDVIIENLDEGVDTVNSSVSYALASNVEILNLTGGAHINATGNTLDNALNGNTGGNLLDGGSGADTMAGGKGNDTYVVDNQDDVVVENTGEGTDTVRSLITYVLGENIERLTLLGSNSVNATGNAQGNTLIGNLSANVISGKDGNDTIDGGGGADTLIGGGGNDTYLVNDAAALIEESVDEGSDAVRSTVSYTLASNVESLFLLGSGAINGSGNGGNNVLTGNAATNALHGLGGNDVIDGGGGADTLVGGAGNDTYIVNEGGVSIVEALDEGIDHVKSSVTISLAANIENVTLVGIENINVNGNELNNSLVGNAADNILTGGAGSDVLNGGGGSDFLLGGSGNDVYLISDNLDLITEESDSGVDTVKSSVTYTLGANVENLVLTGTADVNGTGNNLNNVLTGNDGANVLNGGSGNDTLNGSGGADTLLGGAGNDIYVVDNALLTLIENGDEGIDTVKSSVSFVLGDNIENLTLTGTAAISALGNALNNQITGNGIANFLDGLGGDDTIQGNAANDILRGDEGNDVLRESGGNNLFDGGAGSDGLIGKAGNEMFIGGAGNDSIYTGLGSDVIVFNRGDGQDTVIAGTGADNTISLGGGIRYNDLTLRKSSNDLVLGLGGSEQITLKNWYGTTGNHSVVTLQIIIASNGDYEPQSTDAMLNDRIERFNFAGLVERFDLARGASPSMTTWAMKDAMLSEHLGGSDSEGVGGYLAYQYGMAGTLAGTSFAIAQEVLGGMGFGVQEQSVEVSLVAHPDTAIFGQVEIHL